MTEDEARLRKIFFPYAESRTQEVVRACTRLAYYTSAETALKILSVGEFWMRNARVMNDYDEIQYGLDHLRTIYRSAVGMKFQQTLNGIFPDLTTTFLGKFNQWVPAMLNDTHLACFSEHLPSEDNLGRLSMWRAYGQPHGVAIVLNTGIFMGETEALGIYSSPVAYMDGPQLEAELVRITQNIADNRNFIGAQGEETIHDSVFNMFQFMLLCTKHPGFHEEREWRAICSRTFGESTKYRREVECINGTPQVVIKVKLEDSPSEQIVGLELPKFVDRVIIGPSELPFVIRDALAEKMVAAGIADVPKKIVVSDIPLRTA
jgi:hypothetical protein